MGKLKRMIASLSVVAVLSSFVLPTSVLAFEVSSVPAWAQAGVQALVDAGAVDGDAPSFRAGDYVNRAELAKMIDVTWALADGATKDFSDVAPTDWFYGPVQRSYAAGVIGGYPDGTFGPARLVNRAEAMKMLTLASGVELAPAAADFSDVNVSDWFATYVATGVREGWVKGYPDGTFRPADYMNRAELAKTLAMAADLVEGGENPEPTPTCEEGMMMEEGVCVPMPPQPTSGDVTVSVSPMTPATASVPAGASSVPFAAFDLTAGSEAAKVDELTVTRKGVIKDGAFEGLYLYHENGTRLTSQRSLNSDTHSVTFSNLGVMVPANDTVTLYVRADIVDKNSLPGTGDARFELSGAEHVVLEGGATAGGSFPVSGNLMGVQNVQAGSITVKKSGTVNDATIGEFAKISEFRLEADGEDALLQELALTVKGSIDESGVTGLELKSQDGDVLAMAEGVSGDENLATFVLADGYKIPEGASRRFTVHAKLTGDAGDTVETYFDEDTDILAVGDDFGFGLGVTRTDYDGNTCPSDCSELTLEGGDVTLAFNGPVARDISLGGQDIRLLEFSMTSVAAVTVEGMKVKVYADDDNDKDPFDGVQDVANDDPDGLINAAANEGNLTDIKVVDLDSGRTVMSSEELVTSGHDAVQELSFNDTFNIKAGETLNLAVTVDVTDDKDFAGTKVGAELILGSGALELEDANGDKVADKEIVPSTNMTGNTMTVVNAELFLSLAGTPTSDDYVKGSKLVPLTGINFRASDAEEVTITDLTLTCYSDTNGNNVFGENGDTLVQDFISSLELHLDGKKVAGPKSVEVDGQVLFDNMGWKIASGQTERLVVKANLAKPSSVTSDKVACGLEKKTDIAAVDKEGDNVEADEPVNNKAVLNAGNGTVVTIEETGSLAYKVEGTPDSSIVIAGSEDVHVAKYKFTSVNEAFVVDDLDVLMTTDANTLVAKAAEAAAAGVVDGATPVVTATNAKAAADVVPNVTTNMTEATTAAVEEVTARSNAANVAGDLDGNAVVNAADHAIAKNLVAAAVKAAVGIDTSANAYTRVTLKYTDADGNERATNGNFSGDRARFTGLNFYVPENEGVFLRVFVDLNTVQSGATSGSEIRVVLNESTLTGVNNFEAIGEGSGQTLLADNANLTVPNNTDEVKSSYLRKSKPVIALKGNETELFKNNTKNTLYKYSVTADNAGSVSMKAIRFRLDAETSGGNMGLFKFKRGPKDITDKVSIFSIGDASLPVATALADGTSLEAVGAIADGNFNGYVVVLFDENASTEEVVSAGDEVTYELTAHASGVDVATDSANTFIEDDNVVLANTAVDTADTVANYIANGFEVSNLLWSDNSADNHSVSTVDWTNGHLVEGLDGDSKVRSLSFSL